MFIRVMQEVRGIHDGIRKTSGTRIADGDGNIIYTPPEGESLIRDKPSQLEYYVHSDDGTDSLIKAALFRYQFEAIHPFSDGNGRTGRLLTILYLISQGLLDLPVLYLSKYILDNRRDYYQGLRDVTEKGAWIPWIMYVLTAIEKTAIDTRKRLEAIHAAMKRTQRQIRQHTPKIYSNDLVELIFQYPYCKIRFVENSGMGKRATASKYLKELERIGILQSLPEGNEVYYINRPLMDVLR